MCPAERAAYPSTTLMNVVPAKVAGVPKYHIMTTPAGADGRIKSRNACRGGHHAGVDAPSTKWSGAREAVAALAYGTERKCCQG